MHHRLTCTLTLGAALLASPWVSAQVAMSEREIRAVMQEALDLAKQERWSEACTRSRGIGRLEAMRTGDDAERAEVLANAGYLHVSCERWEDAYWVLKASTTLLPDAWALYNLSIATVGTDRHRETVGVMERIAAIEPVLLDENAANRAWRTFGALEGDRPAQRRLFQAFLDAGHVPVAGDNARMWLTLADMHLEAGRPDLARMALHRVVNVRDRVRLHADRRFDAIIDMARPGIDERAAAQRNLDLLELQAKFKPDDASVWVELGTAKLAIGDHEGVIADVTRVLGKAGDPDRADGGTRSLKNGYYQAWLLYLRGVAHARRGDIGSALSDLKRAVAMPMTEGDRSIHRRNLAQLQCYTGDAAQALDTMDGLLAPASERETVISIRAVSCAFAQERTGDRHRRLAEAVEAKFLDTMPLLVVEAHLWVGNVDRAERILVDQLASTRFRGEALLFVQRGMHTEGMPGRLVFDTHRDTLLARPTVKAAIDKVGRVQESEFYLGLELE